MRTTEYQVSGMTCAHCERAVRDEVSQIDGVTAVEVSVGAGRLTVTAGSQPDDASVIAAVDEAGYTAARV